jgi:hypothetical protein
MDRNFSKEKNQQILPTPEEAQAEWTTLAQNKRSFKRSELTDGKLNTPTGHESASQRGFKEVLYADPISDAYGNETDRTTTKDLARGYSRVKMRSTDEVSSNGQVVQFYTDVGDGSGENGFIERQNVLDRF